MPPCWLLLLTAWARLGPSAPAYSRGQHQHPLPHIFAQTTHNTAGGEVTQPAPEQTAFGIEHAGATQIDLSAPTAFYLCLVLENSCIVNAPGPSVNAPSPPISFNINIYYMIITARERPRTRKPIKQTVNQILKAPHEHKRSHIIPAQPHGRQTPRREASQAWGPRAGPDQSSVVKLLFFRCIFAYKLGIFCFEVEHFVCLFCAHNAYFARLRLHGWRVHFFFNVLV